MLSKSLVARSTYRWLLRPGKGARTHLPPAVLELRPASDGAIRLDVESRQAYLAMSQL